jgi:tetratricopeptide (TPR) repeat protein
VVWSRSFPGSEERLFALQRDIARELTRVLSISLSWKERRRMARDPTRSSRAFDYYLQGQEFLDDVDNPRGPQFAAEVFRQALLSDGDFALAHVGLSEALWRRYQQEKQAEVLQEAEREARTALEIDPDLPSAQVALARVYRSTGRHAESIAELRQILERHPRPDEAYRELAFSYEEVGELEAAEQALEASVALRDDHWHRWNSLGAFLQRLGRYAEASEAFERAVELAPPTITWPYENLAAVRMREADFDGAIEAYERFGEDTRDPGLASNIATAYFFTGRLAEAEELYRKAVDLAPADPVMRVNLGDVLVRLERVDEARSEYQAAHRLQQQRLEDNPGDGQLRLMGTVFAAKAGECEVAGRLAEGIAGELPRTADNLHYLAWAHALCGNSRRAIEALRGAVELGIPAELLRQEDELRVLRDDPEFQALVGVQARSSAGAQAGLSP